MLLMLTVLAAAWLAFANGANDVSRGVATLAGSGRASYRAAIAWGTLWTLLGACASLAISMGLVRAFTTAIVGPEVLALPSFGLAVASGAAVWVLLAAATGLPVSTTHSLTGAIVGVAVVAGGAGAVSWWVLASIIAAPLALSPLVSAVIGYLMHAVASRVSPACVCVGDELQVARVGPEGTASGALETQVIVSASGCAPDDVTSRLAAGDIVHWTAAAALSFARAVNDNAKLAAIALLGLATTGTGVWVAFSVTALAMTVGSHAAGLRVTRTLGERVVHMDKDTGLAAAFVSAGLVLAASIYALPVSTTHVSTGAIVGAGVRQGGGAVEWGRVRSLVVAWIGTLPIAAALAGTVAWLMLGRA